MVFVSPSLQYCEEWRLGSPIAKQVVGCHQQLSKAPSQSHLARGACHLWEATLPVPLSPFFKGSASSQSPWKHLADDRSYAKSFMQRCDAEGHTLEPSLVEFDDLQGLSQAKCFCDSMTACLKSSFIAPALHFLPSLVFVPNLPAARAWIYSVEEESFPQLNCFSLPTASAPADLLPHKEI